jgi:hypothetical protein
MSPIVRNEMQNLVAPRITFGQIPVFGLGELPFEWPLDRADAFGINFWQSGALLL